eukprot:GDKI01035129.1.p1 GENE.GDKI01035129.1~~GDKI01035129.1.p1  ORF type:complete len:184 (+),score=42.59 GDKI01035129.1:73-624(+)
MHVYWLRHSLCRIGVSPTSAQPIQPPIRNFKHCITPSSTMSTDCTSHQPAADSAAAGSAPASAAPTDPIVQYVVVRKDLLSDLKWPMGAVITQACHASVAAVVAAYDDPDVKSYLGDIDRMHKVTLAINNESELRALSEKLSGASVSHKLWVEQPENIATCLAAKPGRKSAMGGHFRGLKLFK